MVTVILYPNRLFFIIIYQLFHLSFYTLINSQAFATAFSDCQVWGVCVNSDRIHSHECNIRLVLHLVVIYAIVKPSTNWQYDGLWLHINLHILFPQHTYNNQIDKLTSSYKDEMEK